MQQTRLGNYLIAAGALAWIVYFGITLLTDIELPFKIFLAWHLLGVIPGMLLRGSKILKWVTSNLKG